MANKYVYMFSEANATMKNLLGGKGANLAEMTSLGLPVPQGFTVSTEACTQYYKDGKKINDEILAQIDDALAQAEKIVGKKLGDLENPFLVSVRSGARVSMPGMMDTVLNLGLNDTSVKGLAKLTGNERFAYDSYRRFIQMFSDVVMGLSKARFEEIITEMKEVKGVSEDTELTAKDLMEMVEKFKAFYKEELGSDFPQDPKQQLISAIEAVFESWDNERAVIYRRMNNISSSWGTAVNVQAMVFGNMGEDSGTGVAFTRDPVTGEKRIFGEYLMNAQGEDVVAGVRTPLEIATLQETNPTIYNQFMDIAVTLENHYRDMQDMEFTIERGTLYMLQTRNGKRTSKAALKIAVDLVQEGMLTKEEAIMKVEPGQLDTLLHPQFETKALAAAKPIAKGLPASPGAACGKVYFTAEEAVRASEHGEKVVLVRMETSPEDIEGMYAAEGILTARGGMTSHAAVVARGMGVCCVAGCGDIKINEKEKFFSVGMKKYREGDYISINGATGQVYGEKVETMAAEVSGEFATLMAWADDIRTLNVRTNADTPQDAAQAVEFGAEGIGLCRTEHMFFEEDRIAAVREMIVSTNDAQRRAALEKLLPMQKEDFKGIFREMAERPVTIRFLDPPLHEFVPKEASDIKALAKEMDMKVDELEKIIEDLEEVNPMLGHRGCRLAVSYPAIAEMQTRAVIEAAIEVEKECKIKVVPEIMIPLVSDIAELKYVKNIVVKTAELVKTEKNSNMEYKVGTMIEIPRAALTADKIAEEAEFFSFGTNDLTQMTFGFSRDDAGKFLEDYYGKGVFESDPFAHVDENGVGQLMEIASTLGRKTRPGMKLGICGEHGGDPASVMFCHKIGLNYVSCSPFRVPLARLAAAQAAVTYKK